MTQVRRLQFFRDYRAFSGGHLKVWHYYRHATESARWTARILFTAESSFDDENPWRGEPPDRRQPFEPSDVDALFIEGMDWERLAGSPWLQLDVPRINLIQGLRHAHPDNPRFQFLRHRATRVCVSPEVAAALEETGRVNGPLVVIQNGVDPEVLEVRAQALERRYDVFVGGLKNPDMATRLTEDLRIAGLVVDPVLSHLPRREYLRRIAEARVAVLFPNGAEGEGFYLPALEAMALGTLVVCPDCVGNHSFCHPGETALRPTYTYDAIRHAATQAHVLSAEDRDHYLKRAGATAAEFSAERESKLFLSLLASVS